MDFSKTRIQNRKFWSHIIPKSWIMSYNFTVKPTTQKKCAQSIQNGVVTQIPVAYTFCIINHSKKTNLPSTAAKSTLPNICSDIGDGKDYK